jgi:hypothetical protein
MSVSLADQIRAVGREVGMRRSTYAKWVKSGRMTQHEADRELAAMESVYQTLKELQRDTEDR